MDRKTERPQRPRILVVVNVDLMAWKLLRPWLSSLRTLGAEVHIACAESEYFEHLRADGYVMHAVPIRRTFNPLAYVAPVRQVVRILRAERFDLVNAHSPTGAAVARVAGFLARAPKVLYTVHGFYFHDRMSVLARMALVGTEWLLGRLTTGFMFVSDEDRQTALSTGIARKNAVAVSILNGVNLNHFHPDAAERSDIRRELGIAPGHCVIGIVARIVREKGYREYLSMAEQVSRTHPNTMFLVVGDSLASDRDNFAPVFRAGVERAGLTQRFRFTGFVSQVSRYLQAMDIFVLPSYREGFPRSVLEAMATGLPVVATAIRGCREAVIDGQSGLLVPPQDAAALASAVSVLLDQPEMAFEMGRMGRRLAVDRYDERLVQKRFASTVRQVLHAS